MLEPVEYYRIPRDPDRDSRPNRFYERDYEMALRWSPDGLLEDEEALRGERALRSLREGHDVSKRNVLAAISYIVSAIDYYNREPEPYEGRNAEAVNDLQTMLANLGKDDGVHMSWILEDSLRVTIENDPELVSLFSEWLEDHPDVEEVTRMANYNAMRAVFHAKHKDTLVRVLTGLNTELHRPEL